MGSIQDYSVKSSVSPTKVLVVGGSYGGMAAGLNLLDLCNGKPGRCTRNFDSAEKSRPKLPVQVKFVDERDGYYHLIGSPLALASNEYAEKAWVRFDDMPALRAPELSWTQGSAIKVDAEEKVATIKDTKTGNEYEESYDFLIAASGLRRTFPTVPQSFTKKTYISETSQHISSVQAAKRGVVVIGGGAVGIEMAGEIKLVEPNQKVTLIHSRDRLLSSEPLPNEFKDKSLELLKETGVEVILGQRVTDTKPIENEDGSKCYTLTLANGSEITTGHVIFAISQSVPTSTYLPLDSLDEEGYVKINPQLNLPSTVPNYLHHFAIGDIAKWSGIRRCGGAMAMGYNAACNVHEQLLQKYDNREPKFVEYPEVPPVMGLAVGKKAICFGGPDGVVFGEDQMALMFGDDLGFKICWNWLRLGIDGSETIEAMPTKENHDSEVETAVVDATSKLEAVTV